jgi:hypothetical protein
MNGLKVIQFMERPEFTDILKEMIVRSAAPLKAIETDFAIDSGLSHLHCVPS